MNTTHISKRPVSLGMETHIGVEHKVLDHGFIRVVDYMGTDACIEQAARVSYGEGTRAVSDTAKLLDYLMGHHHSSPFEMCEIKLDVKLPVFVARQWIRHRTANVNEYSARYSILDREFYIPAIDRIGVQSTDNKQGTGEAMQLEDAEKVRKILSDDCQIAYADYEEMIGMGLSRELARMNLPTNIYTRWFWKTDLHNLFHFLRLRNDPHAQYEIRVYAEAITGMVADWVPMAFAAFMQHKVGSHTFSARAMAALRDMKHDVIVFPEDYGIGKREWADMMKVLGLPV